MTLTALVLAVFFHLAATSHGGTSLSAEVMMPDGSLHAKTLWAENLVSAILSPPPAGTPFTGYVSITEAESVWRAGGQAVRLVVDGMPSNLVILAAGVRDTFYADVASRRRWQWATPIPCHNRPDIQCVAIARSDPADSAMAGLGVFSTLGPLAHQEQVQRADGVALCRSYGFIGLRGKRDSTLCP